MAKRRHILVIDPIPFNGGSKVATENVLKEIEPCETTIRVLTSDKGAWRSEHLKKHSLREPSFLKTKESGYFYFIRHFIILLNILFIRFKYGKIDLAVGASWPGNDLSIYFAKWLLGMPVLQFVHGPVATSGIVVKCLKAADYTFYLETAKKSIDQCLKSKGFSLSGLKSKGHKFEPFNNGLPWSNWLNPVHSYHPIKLHWSASLLKWKGLDTFIATLQSLPDSIRPQTEICFIRPEKIQLQVTEAPVHIKGVNWHESPENLAQIRSETNVFISTSEKEPFGLSILEAMASGLCIIIPEDGAYWDQKLENNKQCLKYRPHDSQDLEKKIRMLIEHPEKIQQLGLAAKEIASDYRAEKTYQPIIDFINGKNK